MIDRRRVVLGGLGGLIVGGMARAQGGPGAPGAGPGPAGAPPPAGQGNANRPAAQPNSQRSTSGQAVEPGTQPAQPAHIHGLVLSQSYQGVPSLALANTTRDAALIQRAFQRLRFDQVTLHSDGTPDETMARIVGYLRSLDPDTIALVYLAGHGVEIAGENLLLLEGGTTFLSLQALVQALQQRSGVAVLFLDACRSNPFNTLPASGRRISRALALEEGGPVRVETVSLDELTGAPSATLDRLRAFTVQGSGIKIVFSTDPANVAFDGARPSSRNSPFAQALARHIREPISLDDIISLTTGDVIRATRRLQSPWSQGSIDRPIFLSGRRRREQAGRG